MTKIGRRWKSALPFISFFCLALTLATAVYTWRYEPDRFMAVYTFYAVPAGTETDENAVQRARMLARECDELLNTTAFQQSVLAYAPSDGKTFLRAVSLSDTHLIGVEAVGVEPVIVAGLANAAGRELLTQAGAVLGATGMKEIAQAQLPTSACGPKRVVKTLAVLAASFVAFSLLGMLFGSARRPLRWENGKNPSNGLPCIGGVADCESVKKKRAPACTIYDYVDRLVYENLQDTAIRVRSLRSQPGCSLTLIGLSNEEDGAALCALLAAELAAEGFDILLMELDAYKPRLRDCLAVAGTTDVLDCLQDEGALRAAILPTAIPRLCFMDFCHGADGLSYVAAAPAFASLVSDAAQSFDYVILNAPSAAAGHNAARLAAITDFTVLLAKDGRYTDAELSAEAGDVLQSAQRMGGLIFTDVPRGRFSSRYRETGMPSRKGE
ncbi:MAG: hypothetical protein PHI98_07690 [Eubacteriales bacterium]|nr:hypothetical protein [Eubacteriales bacterium]